MSESGVRHNAAEWDRWRERAAWMAALGGVASSSVWMLVFLVASRAHAVSLPPAVWALARALGHVALIVTCRAWPLLLPAAVGGGMVLLGVLWTLSALRRSPHA